MENKSKILILFDCPDEGNDKQWLYDELSRLNEGNVYTIKIKSVLYKLTLMGNYYQKIKAHLVMLWQGIRAMWQSKQNDVIICWLSTTGSYLNILSLLCGNKRNIILLNWLTPIMTNRFNSYYYFKARLAVNNPRCKIIVNSKESASKWCEVLHVNKVQKFYFVPDVFDDSIPFASTITKKDNYCFTGGFNNRDWNYVASLAKLLPDIVFICVGNENDFTSSVPDVPSNVLPYFSIESEQYFNFMKNARLVLLPLKDNRVAGLINIIRAAQYGTLCCSTKTPVTSLYYSENAHNYFLDPYPQNSVTMIRSIFNYEELEYHSKAAEFQEYIKNNFSPQTAANSIFQIISVH